VAPCLAELGDPSNKSLEIKLISTGTQQCFRVCVGEEAKVIFLPPFSEKMPSCYFCLPQEAVSADSKHSLCSAVCLRVDFKPGSAAGIWKTPCGMSACADQGEEALCAFLPLKSSYCY